MISTAAMALALSVPPFAVAQTTINQPDPGPVEAALPPINVDLSQKTIDSYNKKVDITKKTDIDVTKKLDIDVKKTTNTNEASGAFAASANNNSTASSKLNLNLTNAFNKTTLVNTTKLDGHVSGNRIQDIGNTGGYAANTGNTGAGGDGGNAKAVAHSKAVANGGDGDSAKASGGDGGKSSIDQDAKNGYARNKDNNEKGDGKGYQTAKAWAEARANGADGGKGGKADADGGDGGKGGKATSGYATAKRTDGGDGGYSGDLRVRGGNAGTFDASNTIRGSLNHAAGIPIVSQNTGASSLQQVGVSVMANIGSLPSNSMSPR
jgi:hypothetical protein